MSEDPHIPPHDLEAEQAVLGAMLVADKAVPVVADLLTAEDFYRESHRAIFSAILSVHTSGGVPDVVTVSSLLPSEREFVNTLAEFVPAAANAAHYAHIVRQKSMLRDIIRAGNEIAELGYTGSDNGHRLIDVCEEKMVGVLQRRKESEGSHTLGPLEALSDLTGDVDERRSGSAQGMPWPIEWPGLARRIGPIEPGSLTIIAARPSVGKSIFGLQLMRFLSAKGYNPLFVSRELTVVRLMRRHLVSYGANMRNLQSGDLNDRDMQALDDLSSDSGSWRGLYDTHSKTVAEIKREVEVSRPDLVIIDYLQRLTYDTEKEYAGVTRIVNELQDVTLTAGVPVVCLSQLSRPLKGLEWKAPTMSDIRGSGAVEERAANVVMLHRRWETDHEEIGGRRVEVAKVQTEDGWFLPVKAADGETGSPIPVTFDGAHMRIVEKL